ncbi:uncharacterized protein LOC106068680 [Biomphalaria glabrata]|uniref:Uncharacterized protein LOC106068680 n=1 Tax=Biomphalaria glabrata TaxID=6526 RepID=A0A9W2YXM1_BIOGL|nr:uncharacterized protein LOC106068680 [Biomphalaria glabrata]XP_055867472.1 uncharacterized protein LOC106068680 [Biomphalaria glabrata]XP_055867473.1 uncharacterized protein LOC106068680 [Biomphalaria glabrata]XP_055867474.1 uncharacterized protein LOC106068680 [Biomphalaria glabrata]XP_055867475.1 uncharacterized protein LOC106068680 [Biomphalaria glabrata]
MGLFQTKFDYGTHETAVFKSDDVAEVENQKRECQKDHTKYIPVNELLLEKLPAGYREQNLFDLIQCMAELTVRITVKFCSAKRRKYWMGTEAEYPGYKDRGKESRLIGSGQICDVLKVENGEMKCPCDHCKGANSEKRDVWNIHVFTATHVVYDSDEAEKSEIKLFYEGNDGRGNKTFYGVGTIWSNANGDLCVLSCVTCDQNLAASLLLTIKQINILWKSIRENYQNDKKESNQRKYKDRIVVIVSHPHGGGKCVSFDNLDGRVWKWIYIDNRGWHLNYKASTCTGSSGAPVYLYGMDWDKTAYAHSGCNGDCNYSTTWCPK